MADSERGSGRGGRGRDRGNFQKRGFGGRGRGGGRGKNRDMGRSEYGKQKPDKRSANNESQANKRQKLENGEAVPLPVYATKFDEEELKAEERRPKKKVAVMIGYSGTGYKGMQLAHDQKTIEGDLFKAFVQAGAISKANADDPKKSSFVRCARTDKGVHAAGNIISLKLIIEDKNIVEKINEALVPQIRIWGYERTNNSFSAYQLCDSRIYEYLIPTHSLLPPHPRSWLGRKCQEWAEKKDDVEQWLSRQEEVRDYWGKVDAELVQPILDEYDENIRNVLHRALFLSAERAANRQGGDEGSGPSKKDDEDFSDLEDDIDNNKAEDGTRAAANGNDHDGSVSAAPDNGSNTGPIPTITNIDQQQASSAAPPTILTDEQREARRQRHRQISEGIKRIRAAYLQARRAYRLPPTRQQRLQDTLNQYLGTRNFHNYTILKSHRDPSAKRVIKSFTVAPTPLLIDGTEWLSLKVHGQSFMMHQIRKMVGMATLVVRCGADPALIPTSYTALKLSIPKAPALGLLLERPVFDSYNRRAAAEFDKRPIGFEAYEAQMLRFKQEWIYDKIYRDEERENVFGNFYGHVDNFPSETFLWATSGGVEAAGGGGGAREESGRTKKVEAQWESGDEDEGDGAGEEG